MRATVSLSAVAVSCLMLSGPVHPDSSSQQTSRLVELKPAVATRELVDRLLHDSTSLTIFYTPQRTMGRVGYSRDLLERRSKFDLTIRCGSTCDLELAELSRRLSTARRMTGDCPRPIATIIYFSSNELARFESLYATSNGQCFSIRGQAYFLDKEESLAELIRPLEEVLTDSTRSQDR